MGLCQNQAWNFCCGYRSIIFTVNLNLMIFSFSQFYISLLYLFLGHDKDLKNILKLGVTAQDIL
jgi:hypothetical protein